MSRVITWLKKLPDPPMWAVKMAVVLGLLGALKWWWDTAALLGGQDVVITVATLCAGVIVAAAIATPTLMLLWFVSILPHLFRKVSEP